MGLRRKFTPVEGLMFEEQKESPTKQVWVIVVIIAAVVVVGVVLYTLVRPGPKAPATAGAGGPSQAATADGLHDVEVVSAVMGKDVTGARVMWSVQLRNKSAVYSYSAIQYEVRLFGPDGTSIGGSEGTINETLGPGEEKQITPFIGGLFEARASRYQFRVKGAKASGQ
jgi:hypothetical protein